MGEGSGGARCADVGDRESWEVVLAGDWEGSDGGSNVGSSAGPYMEDELMRLVLREDFVIPAGTVFALGPAKTTYGGGNFEANIAISNDETMRVVVFEGQDTLELFDHEGES